MNTKEFLEKCTSLIIDYIDKKYGKEDLSQIQVYTVWNCKTLQNNKALLSTTRKDEMYYEITYNGDEKEIYFDAYKKECNKRIKL